MDLSISLTSPLPPEPMLFEVRLDSGSMCHALVDDGWFQGEVPGRPLHARGLAALPEGATALRSVSAAPTAPPAGDRPAVDLATLFGKGIDVPADGALRLEILWLAPCDGKNEERPEQTRFGSVEHSFCAALVGLDEKGKTLVYHGIAAHFSKETLFDVGGKDLDFGMIIALAGDFYAHLDERARKDFDWAWPAMESISGWIAGDYRATTLSGDSKGAVQALHDQIEKEAAGIQFGGVVQALDTLTLRFPMRRYLALASQNHCHFACQNWLYSEQENPALSLYRAYHERAMREAREASSFQELEAAIVVDAFGCHFLTDLFASGHIRTPRAVLGTRFGIAMGALMMSKWMHDEDNRLGLWVTHWRRPDDSRRVVWRAYGDDNLFRPEAEQHLDQIREAVRRSSAEVFAAYCEAKSGLTVPFPDKAEDLVPVPLLPGEGPVPNVDVSPDGQDFADHPVNHLPLYKILEDGRVGERHLGKYVPMELPSRWRGSPKPAVA